jgi:hypothetical protein
VHREQIEALGDNESAHATVRLSKLNNLQLLCREHHHAIHRNDRRRKRAP